MVLHTREVFLYCWKATDFYMKVLHEMADATEEMLAFMEELRHLKENIRNMTELSRTAKSIEGCEDFGKTIENCTIKSAISRYKLYLSQEVLKSDKEIIMPVISNFVEELALYATEWSFFFENCMAGCSLRPGDLFQIQTIVIADIAELLIHCKESMTIYENCFLEVSSYLSNLFKSTYHTLKVILDNLEKACLEQCDAKDISIYANCLMQLFDVTLVLNDIDMMPLGNTLKSLNRIISSKESLLHEHLDATRIFKVVCSCIMDKLTYSWSLTKEMAKQVDSKRLSTVFKLLRFLLGMLLRLIKNYRNEIHGNITCWIIDVLMLLQWMTPKTAHEEFFDNLCYKELCNTILIVIEPILMELINERDFIARIRSAEGFLNSNNQSIRQNLSALQLTITIACCLAKAKDDTQDEWMNELSSSCASLIDVAFHLYERCIEQSLETIMIPMAVEEEKPPRNIPLHDYVCIGLCAFISTLKQQNYTKLESCLLRNLMMSSKSIYTIASDVMSFIARWGPDSLCLQLTNFFADLSMSLFQDITLQSDILNRTLQMTRRLFLLLGENKKEHFLSSRLSSIRDHIPLWIIFPVEHCDERYFKKLMGFVAASNLDNLEDWKANDQLRIKKMKVISLSVWENCLKRERALEHLTTAQIDGLSNAIIEVFLNVKNPECQEINEELICSSLGVAIHIIHILEQEHLKEILQVVTLLVENNTSSSLAFKVCQLLSASRSIQYEKEHMECCLSSVSLIFNILLTHQSFFVQYEAMTSLRAFAEVTKHPYVIPDCLPAALNDKFKNFLNNIRFLDDVPKDDMEESFKKALTVLSEEMNQKQHVFEGESRSIEELDIMEKNFVHAVNAIREYSETKRIPESMLKRLKSTAQHIEQLDTL